jgi:hypothetical protein
VIQSKNDIVVMKEEGDKGMEDWTGSSLASLNICLLLA